MGIVLHSPSIVAQPNYINSPTSPIITEIAKADLNNQPTIKEDNQLKSPPITSEPIKVSIGLHISNLADINQAAETFDVAGYLMYSWQDKRLAYNPKNVNSKSVSLEEIWHPAIEMVNFKSSQTAETSVQIMPDGTIMAQERFSKTFSSGLILSKFPFDRQSLEIALESLLYDEQIVKLLEDSPKITIGEDKFVSLSEWQIGRMTGEEGKSFFSPENKYYSRVTIKINVTRNSGFYVLKIMLPLLMITIASWSVFWIDPQEFSTQISIAFTNLLTVVALLLMINDTLPRVGYLTLMDGFTIVCFLTILIAIFELVFTHRLETHDGHQRAEKIHHFARWLVPNVFIFCNLILFLAFLF